MSLLDALLSKAAEALDKQEPKEPVMRNGFYQCPACGADEFFLMYDGNIHDRYDYCASCGQRLKWEGVDDG